MVVTINRKAKHIDQGKVIIFNDNKILVSCINFPLLKENQFTIEVEAEISKIRKIIKHSSIEIEIVWINGHGSITQPFCKDSGLYMIAICHRKANVVQKNIY